MATPVRRSQGAAPGRARKLSGAPKGPWEAGLSPRCSGVSLAPGAGRGGVRLPDSPHSPHAVQLTLPPGLVTALGPGREYRALQLHLHWGSAGRPGSEHTVEGHRFPAEVSAQLSPEGRRGSGGGDLAHSHPPVLSRSTWFTSALHLTKLTRPWDAQEAWPCWPPSCRYPPEHPPLPWAQCSLSPEACPSTLALAPAYPHSLIS